MLISYESVFLYQLAIDAGLVNCPADNTPTCCRLKNDWSNAWQVNPDAAEFATAFAILLAQIKVEDDVRDSGRWLARGGNWFWSKAFRHATEYFDGIDASLLPKVKRLVDEHIALENLPFTGSPNDYAAPTANAFGLMFGCFAKRLPSTSDQQVDLFYKIGQAIGAGIVLSDCVFDFQKDQRRGEFNPIKNLSQVPLYQQAALRAFGQAGWDCQTLNVDERSAISSPILKFAFDRIARFRPTLVEKPAQNFLPNRRLRRWASMRAGVCDADCDCGGCDGCDCGGEDNSMGCAGDLCCFDACASESRTGRIQTKADQLTTIESMKPDSVLDADVVDLVGVTECPLNPTGYIVIDGDRYPAKTNGEFIERGQNVLVLSRSTFGFVVELAKN